MDPSFLIILVLAFGAMWLMSSRTRKQQKEAANFRANLAPGQDVMTGSGLFGTIVAVEGDVVTIETSPGVTSRWLRAAVAKLVEPPVADDEDLTGDEYDEDDYDEDELDEAEEDTGATTAAGSTATGSTATGSTAFLEDNSPRFDVPDDASSITERRRQGDPGQGDAPRA
jgi:preprotein translocase subunit YajC